MNLIKTTNKYCKAIACLTSVAILSLTACTTKKYTDFSTFIPVKQPLVSATEYRLAPPDAILITSRRVPEINGHREIIRPDGRITLPLLGSFFVAGKTIEQTSAELSKLAEKYYEDADVTLRVTRYNSKKIFVFGEVTRPGPYAYTGKNTILKILASAYPTRLAYPSHIQILRPKSDGTISKRMTINLDKMVKTGDTSLNAILEEGDIIYVPANPLAKAGLVIQQILLPLQPAASLVQSPVDIYSAGQTKPIGNRQYSSQ